MRRSALLLQLLATSLVLASTLPQSQKAINMEPNLGPALPPKTPSSSGPISGGDTVILSDVLGRDRSINIFAGFTRDISLVDERLGDEKSNTTVLAPVNSAIMALPRKPWEDPKDYESLGTNAYEGQDGEARAHKNLRRFVEEHVVPASPWSEGEKVKTLAGGEVWWELKDGVKLIQPGAIEVTSIASKVANGEVWILKAARNYA